MKTPAVSRAVAAALLLVPLALLPGCELAADSAYFAPCGDDGDCPPPLSCDPGRSVCLHADPIDGGASDAGSDAGSDVGAVLDVDSDAEWQAGRASGLGVAGGAVEVAAGLAGGTWDSPIVDAHGAAAIASLTLSTPDPSGLPLPDGSDDASERSLFARGGADLTGLVLLLHLDAPTGLAPSTVLDLSVSPHELLFVDASPSGGSAGVAGVLGNGLFLSREDWLAVQGPTVGGDFIFDGAGFTFSAWIQVSSCADSEDNIVALGGQQPHNWIGIDCLGAGEHAHMTAIDDLGNEANADSIADVADGSWHHVAGVVRIASPGLLQLYVDGLLVDSATAAFTTFELGFTDGLFLGNFPIGLPDNNYNYESELGLDEVAVWKRPLDADEVAALYRRGATRALALVRTCAQPADCAATPFVGPDGTGSTAFAPGRPTVPVLPIVGRYVQARVQLERGDTALPVAAERLRLVVAAP